jgi:hypothetical protein
MISHFMQSIPETSAISQTIDVLDSSSDFFGATTLPIQPSSRISPLSSVPKRNIVFQKEPLHYVLDSSLSSIRAGKPRVKSSNARKQKPPQAKLNNSSLLDKMSANSKSSELLKIEGPHAL